MDILKLNPNDVGDTDDTYEVEGYEDHIEDIENQFPEEDFRTPEEIAEAQALEEDTTPEENIKPTAVETQNPLPQPEEETGFQPKATTSFFTPDENGMISDEQLTAAYGGKIPPEGVRRALKLNYGYLEEKEGILSELFKDGNNLEKQAQAFAMIKNDPELTARYDHNGDGQITYDDFFDTTNHEDWDPELKRLNPEVDAQLTAEWLAGLENPTLMSRAKALWQQNGAGQNMARYINVRRRHALSEAGMGEEGWLGYNGNVAEGLRQNAAGALFDLSSLGLEVSGRIASAAEEGDLSLLTKNSDLDERLLQTKNEQSLEYLVNHNIARSAGDFLTYEAAYWAIPTIVTGGVAGAVGTKSMALGATLKSPTLIRAGMFLKPTLTGGKVVATSKIGGGIGTTVIKPATGFFGRQKLVQGLNMVKSGAKTTLISDLPLAAFSNLEEDGRGMIQEDGFFQTLFEQYPESAIFAPQIAQGINSPLFKQLDFIATETAYGTMGVVVLVVLDNLYFQMVKEY